jgi:hypothetical protein
MLICLSCGVEVLKRKHSFKDERKNVVDVAVIVVAGVVVGIGAARDRARNRSAEAARKIAPWIIDQTGAGQRLVLVVLADQADVRGMTACLFAARAVTW